MAGDWMKITLDLPDKPEVHQIAALTKLDCDTVVGKLVRVWGWFDQQTTNGNARGVTLTLVDRFANHTGFGKAMQQAGWMTVSKNGIIMPNFGRHNGQSAKKRALTERRVKRFRNASDVTKSLPEKRREEKNKNPVNELSSSNLKGQPLFKKMPQPNDHHASIQRNRKIAEAVARGDLTEAKRLQAT